MKSKSLDHYKTFLVLAILIAFFIRFYSIDIPNLYYDEGGVVIGTRLFLNEGLSPWDYYTGQPPPLLFWLTSVSFIILGISELSLRIVDVIFGTLTIVLLYFIVKLWYNKKVAILAAFLLAVLPLHVTYSRLGVNSDIIQTFFLLFAIFIMEYCCINRLNGSKELFAVVLSGIAFGLSFLAKFNALILWGIYWIFIFLSYFKRRLKVSIKKFIISNLAAFTVIITATGLNLSNIFYLVYGFAYLIVAQSTLSAYPLYYRLLLLVDALSPLVFLVLIISLIYIIAEVYKKRNRSDILILSLVLGYFILTILQPRTAARHFIIITPLMVTLVSKFTIDIYIKFSRRSKFLGKIIILTLIAFSMLWSIYEINKDIDYSVWDDVKGYINKNIPEHATVYALYPYWPLAHRAGNSTFYTFRLQRNVVMEPSIQSVKRGDVFVIGNFNVSFGLTRQGLFSGALEVFGKEIYRREIRPYPKSEEFIKKNADLIKTFYCDKEACIEIYQMANVNYSKIKEFGKDEKWSFFASEKSKNDLFLFSCNLVEKQPFSSIITKFNTNPVMNIERKCKKFR